MLAARLLKRLKSSHEAKDTLWLFLLQGVDRLMPLIVVPYLMIILGAEKYGYIGFSLAAIQYLMMFIDFGFNFSASKRISISQIKDDESINRIASSTFIAKSIFFIIGGPILLFLIYFIPKLHIYFITTLCLLPMAIGSLFSANWFFQGIGKIRIIAIITSICKLLIFPLIFIFVKNNSDYNVAALIHGGVYFAAGVISFFILFYKRWFKFVLVSPKEIKIEIVESLPLFLSTAAGSTYTQLFTIILGFFTNPAAVGTYSAAERIMRTLCLTIYHPIVTAYYPMLAKLGVTNRKQGELILQKITKYIKLVMIILSGCIFIFAGIISKLLGHSYAGVENLLRIIAITPIFIALGGIAGQMGLLALGDNLSKKRFRNIYILAAPLSLILVSFFAWWFEETGAAIAMVITEFFIFIGMYINNSKDSRRL